MPIYEYQCQACTKVTDALQKMSDAPLVTCPECEKDALKKLVSAPRFRLAGAGWYETDFKKDNQRNLATSDSESNESKSDVNKAEKHTENKTANKAENKSEKTEAKKETKSTAKSVDKTAKVE